MKHCFQENQLRTVRQNRFAVCLCAVRRCCVVRIAYECFLDCSLLEVFLFSRWRTAFTEFSQILVTAYYPLFAGGSLPPAPLAELSQLDRFCLRLDSYSRLFRNMRQIRNLHQHKCHQNCRICFIQIATCIAVCIQSRCSRQCNLSCQILIQENRI